MALEIQRNIPVSDQLREILLHRIQKDEYPAGARFPSESELCEEFKVSRATVRTALAELTARGYLYRQTGVGTFLVKKDRLETGLERLESVLSIAQRQGLQPTVRKLVIDRVLASVQIAKQLGVKEEEPVTRVSRAIFIDEEPVSYHTDFVPAKIISSLRPQEFTGSMLDYLTTQLKMRIVHARTEITARNADGELMQSLCVPEGCALILLKETLFVETGGVVGYSDNYFVPERFHLSFVRQK